uniref:Uncharacterized protein n=1 Tax=Glossina brevipalpis TaxID=37001 RepID=A0A1A9X122_9MUSC
MKILKSCRKSYLKTRSACPTTDCKKSEIFLTTPSSEEDNCPFSDSEADHYYNESDRNEMPKQQQQQQHHHYKHDLTLISTQQDSIIVPNELCINIE